MSLVLGHLYLSALYVIRTYLLPFYYMLVLDSLKGLVIKYRGGWAGRNRGWVINFRADKKGWVT